ALSALQCRRTVSVCTALKRAKRGRFAYFALEFYVPCGAEACVGFGISVGAMHSGNGSWVNTDSIGISPLRSRLPPIVALGPVHLRGANLRGETRWLLLLPALLLPGIGCLAESH